MAADRPKKPMTAFLLYLEEYRPSIVEKLRPEAKVRGMISKTAGEQWRNLAAEIKAPYEQKAAAAKAKYNAALKSFKQTGGKVVRKRKADKDAKSKKDKDALKKPSGGGYGVFFFRARAVRRAGTGGRAGLQRALVWPRPPLSPCPSSRLCRPVSSLVAWRLASLPVSLSRRLPISSSEGRVSSLLLLLSVGFSEANSLGSRMVGR